MSVDKDKYRKQDLPGNQIITQLADLQAKDKYSEVFFSQGLYPIVIVCLRLWCGGSAIYSRTSMAGTLMTHSPWLARTIIMVPTDH